MATNAKIRQPLRQRLSKLNLRLAGKMLGEGGSQLIRQGGAFDIDAQHVFLSDDLLRLEVGESTVTMTVVPAPERLYWNCSTCYEACEHVGAAIALILEEKTALGLEAAKPDRASTEPLTEKQLIEQALADRAKRAADEDMTLHSSNPGEPWTDYTITSETSGKTYRVALRGHERGESFCSCPDYRKNTLGTCKHIMFALTEIEKTFSADQRGKPHRRRHVTVHIRYGHDTELCVSIPENLDVPLVTGPIDDIPALVKTLAQIERDGHTVKVYPDADEHIQHQLYQDRIHRHVADIRNDPASHPLRTQLLETELLPYQLDGIAFAVGAGRAVLADDMGLGKTIQGIGVAELLAREAAIEKVLVVCPASLKSQWRNEIESFCERSCQVILGGADERELQYRNPGFFTVCNYEQVVRDFNSIESVKWDLIILDEGQRIKNWEAKTSRVIKALNSPFALVISGTPLENRLDDLYSIVEFIDDRRLAPAFRFFNHHRVVDEKGKVIGYKNLTELRENLKPVLLRRTRAMVLRDLPERTTEIVRIAPTPQQSDIHQVHMLTAMSITGKKFLTEMDLVRLQKALLMCRMCADSTFLVDKVEPGYSSKLEALDELLEQLLDEDDRKIVLFSEWTSMLGLVEPLLEKQGAQFVRLDGSVPQKKREQLVQQFHDDEDCRLFITTNAGSTGLNLQCANTVINVDLPWNPAVLEQRIARAHRMGQQRQVQVFVLVTEDTLEEKLLATLSAKHELALAALDPETDLDKVDFSSGVEDLKRRLTTLLGEKPVPPKRDNNVAAAGGQLISAAFQFIGEMVPDSQSSREMTDALRERLAECVEHDESGQPCLTVTLPDRASLDQIAEALGRIMAATKSQT